jgi:hypothetical protein
MVTALLLSGNPAGAEASPYPPPEKFIPLPAASGPSSQVTSTGKPAKFFALAQPRFLAPSRNTKDMKIMPKTMPAMKDEQLPPEFAGAGTGKKTNMTQEQAKQIISIFTLTQ